MSDAALLGFVQSSDKDRLRFSKMTRKELFSGRCEEGHFLIRWWGKEGVSLEAMADAIQEYLTVNRNLPEFEIFPAPDYTPGRRTRGCCPFCGATAHSYRLMLSDGSLELGLYLKGCCQSCGGSDPHCSFCVKEKTVAQMYVACCRCGATGPPEAGKDGAWQAWQGLDMLGRVPE